ncbi:MAG: biotin/lipoyl-containing protein [Deferribacterota bacterium]|nr:biotin/lipoyl-containing protein [Deferribacterota bacterium]
MITKRKYYAEAEGSEYKVEIVERKNGYFEVKINNELHIVDFVQISESIYSIIIDNKSYAVDITEHNDRFEVLTNGDFYEIEILDEIKKMLKDKKAIKAEGKQILTAPMSGSIGKILVDSGDEVKEGQAILILVAMKMENEIKAAKDGVVKEIYINVGDSVTSDQKLALIE